MLRWTHNREKSGFLPSLLPLCVRVCLSVYVCLCVGGMKGRKKQLTKHSILSQELFCAPVNFKGLMIPLDYFQDTGKL